MKSIRPLKDTSGIFFILWCMLASFGAYFCMYAFRKPFTTSLYEGYQLWGIGYKTVLIISQVLGYMISKFVGIKVISELRPSRRIFLILGLILFAEAALLGFGLVPFPFNFVFLFLSGLPLGMVWGVVFSFLEGRRVTEVISIGLSISLIVASGILKTIYLELHQWLPAISEFWMPFVIGLLFLPLFCFFVWMLSVIPEPSHEDKLLRKERRPMNRQDKKLVLKEYGFGLACLVMVYALLATLRDFRDNFSVEIWTEITVDWNSTVFSQTEMISGCIVLLAVGAISVFKNNVRAFRFTLLLITFGIVLSGVSTLLFQEGILSPFLWMLFLGIGLFLAYIPIQTALFERMIAAYRINANAGFFVYICDAIGYLGSVGLLIYKEFFAKELRWSVVLIEFSFLTTLASLLLLLVVYVFYYRKLKTYPAIQPSREPVESYI
ncbi:DUF5690 family protein [Catalinimonas niigatensis]|uniref:DUF5690 family protein n=1 Tax=Catalinimonas niigatensis TaxID=1397264 RepID=UPI0026653C3D|nr:DUF5690 family protein [Catalinimonas niigatensis]WPP50841.1 DUF5690 family protein [Catalinimonas niigatensis]